MSFTWLQQPPISGSILSCVMLQSGELHASPSDRPLPSHLPFLSGELKTSCLALGVGWKSCRVSGCSSGNCLEESGPWVATCIMLSHPQVKSPMHDHS